MRAPTDYGRTRFISETHTLKVLADRTGIVFSLTTKVYSYLLFVSNALVGLRKIRTSDRIVAKAGYDIGRTVALIDEFYGKGGL